MKIAICTFPTMVKNEDNKPVPLEDKYIYRTSSPYNVYLLGAIMEKAGYEIDIKDWICNDFDIEEGLKELFDFHVVMMSCASWNWSPVRFLIEKLHSPEGGRIIVLGGIHATLFSEEIIREFPVDYIICGEGEKAIVPLLQAIEKKIDFRQVPGLVYKEKGEIRKNPPAPLITGEEMALLPLPLYDRLPSGACKWLAVESSRGCVNNCTFCSDPYKKFWRPVPAKTFVHRIEASLPYLPKVSKGEFLIIDDSFIININRAMEIAKELKERRLEIKAIWNGQIKELASKEMLRALKPYTEGILLGTESFHEETLKKIGKKFLPRDIMAGVEVAKELGMAEKLIFSFIIGFPWQNKKMIMDEIDMIYDLACNTGGMVIINWFLLTPGSQMWDEYHREKNIPFNNFGNLWREWHKELHPEDIKEIILYITYLQTTIPGGFYRIQAISHSYRNVCWL